MSDVKRVVWSSDKGKLPAGEKAGPGPLKSALEVLEQLGKFFEPFSRKLSADTGDARVVISVEYREENRGIAAGNGPDVDAATVVKKKFPPIQPFKIVGAEPVIGVLNLPCPKCKAPAGRSCQPWPSKKNPQEPGIDSMEQAIRSFYHSERTSLLTRYREYSPENQ